MSSKFVSAGGEEVKAPDGLSEITDDAWSKARKQVEESRQKPKDQGPKVGEQEGGLSLYEHLQAQKAAKQEAFEEATKLRNQFRPLDDGEVEFLEGVKERERIQAEKERNETAAQLEAFRKDRLAAEELAQGDVDRQDRSEEKKEEGSGWTAAKKRRRDRANDEAGVTKARKLSTPEAKQTTTAIATTAAESPHPAGTKEPRSVAKYQSTNGVAPQPIAAPVSSLVTYDSDSDD